MKQLIIAIILTCMLVVPCTAKKRLYDKTPLYEDPTGWQVWNVKAGEELVSWYLDGKFRAMEHNNDTEIEVFEYMSRGPYEAFYAFPLIIPKGMALLWSKNSTITMTFQYQDEMLLVQSEELFVQTLCGDMRLVFIKEAATLIPSSGCLLFSTSKGNPVIFAKFPLDKTPKKIFQCTVENVITK